MEQKFMPFLLYHKNLLPHGCFRLFRLMLDLYREQNSPSAIKINRRQLCRFTGMSENSLKSALDELMALKIIVIVSERPTAWHLNSSDQYDQVELMRRFNNLGDASQIQFKTATSAFK